MISDVETANGTGRRLPAFLRALRHRDYRLFFFGQLVSLCGTWMQSVAQGWLVLRLTDSPFMLGLVSAVASVPVILFSLAGGMVADRLPKRTVLLATQTTAMLLAFALFVLTWAGVVHVWHVIVLAAGMGVVNAFDAPTRQAFVVEMVGKEDLLNAIALNSTIFNVARMVGPMVAGIIVSLFGEAPVFLMNALSFFAVLVSLVRITVPNKTAGCRHAEHYGFSAMLSYLGSDKRVSALLGLASILGFFCFSTASLLPSFARDVFMRDAAGFGTLSSASGTGALFGALIIAHYAGRWPRARVALFSILTYPLLLLAFAVTRNFTLALFLIMLTGWAGVTSMAIANTLIQSVVPDHLRGRILSLFTLTLLGLSPLGSLASGSFAEALGSVRSAVGIFAAAAEAALLWIVIKVPQVSDLD